MSDFDLKKLTGAEIQQAERLSGVKANKADEDPNAWNYSIYFVWMKREDPKLKFEDVFGTVTQGDIEEFFADDPKAGE